MIDFQHKPVLLDEVIEGLNIKSDGTYVDATVGGGGHSYHILDKLKSGYLYCFDQDVAAIEASRKHLLSLSKSNFTHIHSNFSNMKKELGYVGIPIADGILYDLGVSSFQLDEASRGFSYRFNAALDMRMDQSSSLTAMKVVNEYSEEKLSKILFEFGEERYARQISKSIVSSRTISKIETTEQLVEIIKKSVPVRYAIESGHPAKKTFQAIRIEVNHELDILKKALSDGLDLLKPGGRMCVITFHSLEDRIVKQLFKEKSSPEEWHRGMPINLESKPVEFRLVSNKPILPSQNELENNPRSHSAKLRIIEKI